MLPLYGCHTLLVIRGHWSNHAQGTKVFFSMLVSPRSCPSLGSFIHCIRQEPDGIAGVFACISLRTATPLAWPIVEACGWMSGASTTTTTTTTTTKLLYYAFLVDKCLIMRTGNLSVAFHLGFKGKSSVEPLIWKYFCLFSFETFCFDTSVPNWWKSNNDRNFHVAVPHGFEFNKKGDSILATTMLCCILESCNSKAQCQW